jgi:large repetitive protein
VTVPGPSNRPVVSSVSDGTVTVREGGKVICVMTVVAGKGTCKVSAGSFPIGTSKLTGTYTGSGYKTSQSRPLNLTVTQATTTVALTVTPGKVTYGQEQAARVAVRVATKSGGTPTGTVRVTSGATTVCVIKLSGGAGTCTLAATKLPAGSHSLVAIYFGDKLHSGSSTEQNLTVAG